MSRYTIDAGGEVVGRGGWVHGWRLGSWSVFRGWEGLRDRATGGWGVGLGGGIWGRRDVEVEEIAGVGGGWGWEWGCGRGIAIELVGFIGYRPRRLNSVFSSIQFKLTTDELICTGRMHAFPRSTCCLPAVSTPATCLRPRCQQHRPCLRPANETITRRTCLFCQYGYRKHLPTVLQSATTTVAFKFKQTSN